MNAFIRLVRKRALKVIVPRETLWTRTTRYHEQKAKEEAAGSVEGTTKTAMPEPPRC